MFLRNRSRLLRSWVSRLLPRPISNVPSQLNPADMVAHLEMAATLDSLGSADQALIELSTAFQLHPDDPQLMASRGSLRAACERWGEALEDLDRAVAAGLDTLEVFYHRAQAHLHLGDPQLALADLDEVVNSRPRLPARE